MRRCSWRRKRGKLAGSADEHSESDAKKVWTEDGEKRRNPECREREGR